MILASKTTTTTTTTTYLHALVTKGVATVLIFMVGGGGGGERQYPLSQIPGVPQKMLYVNQMDTRKFVPPRKSTPPPLHWKNPSTPLLLSFQIGIVGILFRKHCCKVGHGRTSLGKDLWSSRATFC